VIRLNWTTPIDRLRAFVSDVDKHLAVIQASPQSAPLQFRAVLQAELAPLEQVQSIDVVFNDRSTGKAVGALEKIAMASKMESFTPSPISVLSKITAGGNVVINNPQVTVNVDRISIQSVQPLQTHLRKMQVKPRLVLLCQALSDGVAELEEFLLQWWPMLLDAYPAFAAIVLWESDDVLPSCLALPDEKLFLPVQYTPDDARRVKEDLAAHIATYPKAPPPEVRPYLAEAVLNLAENNPTRLYQSLFNFLAIYK
jgi:hypothetical protein